MWADAKELKRRRGTSAIFEIYFVNDV